MVSILIMNGPNLNLLGTRQPEVYGSTTLGDIEVVCRQQATAVGAEVSFFQSNHEGDLIDRIHAARGKFDGIILNAGALSHTSIAIMDALFSVDIPTIDMHLSNIHRREEFRNVSYVAKAAIGSIAGFGPGSYLLAIDAMMMHLSNASQPDPESKSEPGSDPLTTTKSQMLKPDDEDESPAPDAGDNVAFRRDVGKVSPATIAAEISAAAASAALPQKTDAEEASAVDAKETKPAAGKNTTSAFNEMFDTPSKEILDSLGIAAPELDAPGNKEEAPKSGKPPIRSFRKFS